MIITWFFLKIIYNRIGGIMVNMPASSAVGLRVRIMCLSGVTCLPVDYCFNELALLKSNSACWSSTKQTSS